MIRWMLLYYLSAPEIVNIAITSKKMYNILFSKGEYSAWSQPHLTRHFQTQGIKQVLWQDSKNNVTAKKLMLIHLKHLKPSFLKYELNDIAGFIQLEHALEE